MARYIVCILILLVFVMPVQAEESFQELMVRREIEAAQLFGDDVALNAIVQEENANRFLDGKELMTVQPLPKYTLPSERERQVKSVLPDVLDNTVITRVEHIERAAFPKPIYPVAYQPPSYPVYQRPVHYYSYQRPVQQSAAVYINFNADPAAVQAETKRILAEYAAKQQQEKPVVAEPQTATVIVDVPVQVAEETATVEIETETVQIAATLPATLTEQQQETINTVTEQQLATEQLRLAYARETQRLKYVIVISCVVSVPLVFGIGWAFPRMLQEIRHLINAEHGNR